MIKKQAYVVKIEDDKALIGFRRHSMCDCCGAGCKVDSHTFEIETKEDLVEGDAVELRTSSGWFVLSAFLVFIVPSILFIIVLYLNQAYILKGLALSVLCLAVYFTVYKRFFLKRYEDNIKTKVFKISVI